MNADALALLASAGLTGLDPDAVVVAADRVLLRGVDRSTGRTVLGSVRGVQDGDPTHVVVYGAPVLPPARNRAAALTDPVVAEQVAQTYFDHLEGGRIHEAAACFANDATYDIPKGGDSRGRYESRADILAWFHERGSSPARHHVEVVAAVGSGEFLVDGWVSGGAAGPASFMSNLRVDLDLRICDYVAVMQVPRVEA